MNHAGKDELSLTWKIVFIILILAAVIVLVVRVSELSAKVGVVEEFIVRAVTLEDLVDRDVHYCQYGR